MLYAQTFQASTSVTAKVLSLSLKNTVLRLNTIVRHHSSHLLLDVIIHTLAPSKVLLDLSIIEVQIGREQHCLE